MRPVKHQCAVLGSPISHSLSPQLHTKAYEVLGLDGWVYARREVDENGLPGFLAGLDPSWAGLSLTMPLKKAIMRHGTPSDSWSRELGIANTAIFDWTRAGEPARTKLYNTDVAGIRLAFEHAGRMRGDAVGGNQARAAKVVIFGNGNTALSALAACTQMADTSDIAVGARRPAANPGLTRFAEAHAGQLALTAMPIDAAMRQLSSADITISTLPPHAADHVAEWLIASGAPVHGTLLDVAYDPHPSALTTAWRRAGGTAVPGEEMLLYQAAVQVCLMTGRTGSSWVAGGSPDAADRRLEEALRTTLGETL